jgi:HAD superfamily hydrolase (TIGR01509 family)
VLSIPWSTIDTVLLDMDGTLLDLHYDTYFWTDHVPRRYAEKFGLDPAEAKEQLRARYRRAEGTLDWYSVDYWSNELGMDIAILKEEVDHLIAVHPHVIEFLDAARAAGKRIVLVTNAHGKAIRIKLEKTRIGGHFDNLICSHDLHLPKEDVEFWGKLQSVEPFNPPHTLLVDDSLPVLRAARDYGIGHLLAVYQPDSKAAVRDVEDFEAIRDFRDVLPGLV